MSICYLGLGSNLDSPKRQLNCAIQEIKKIPKTSLLKKSLIYQTKPMGKGFQPGYCNQVVMIKTRLLPNQLLAYCQMLEKKQRRVKKRAWGPRTLDVDILLYGSLKIKHNHLKIPHPGILYRDFVLKPLLEINPDIKWHDNQYIHDLIG